MNKTLSKILKVLGIIIASLILLLVFLKNKDLKYVDYDVVYEPKEGVYFAVGGGGGYPVIAKSTDGKVWKALRPDDWLSSILPAEAYYFPLNFTGDTVWLKEGSSCIECDGNITVYGIYFSHDLGKTWGTLPVDYENAFSVLTFYSSRYGEVCDNDYEFGCRHTTDGGHVWKNGKLADELKTENTTTVKEYIPFRYGKADDEFQEVKNENGEVILKLPRKYSDLK